MNPYQNINKKEGIKNNKESPFYGRFRLAFNQVYPFREPTYDRALIKIKDELVKEAEAVYESLAGDDISSAPVYGLFHLYKQKDIKKNKFIQINSFEEEDYFFELTMLSDVKYIAMENFYFALLALSPFLEDFQFFIYSTGDADDRWLDEYINKDYQLTCSRSFCDIEILHGRFIYYINRVNNNSLDQAFKLFATWQVYDRLNFLARRSNILDAENDYKRDLKFINDCNSLIKLDAYFDDLSKMYQQLVISNKDYKNTINNFRNWCTTNQV